MLAGLVLGAVLAQAAPLPDVTTDLDRLRKALAETPAIQLDPPPREGPVFKVTIRAGWNEKPLWDDWSHVPSYIRPNMPAYHYEHMWMVTPEEFRGGTFYTVGLPIGPLLELIGKHMAFPHTKTREEKAREEVRQALDEFLACRADPTRPGCSFQ